MKRLEGKVAIITGAARGIGRGIALKFAKEGATVVLVGRNKRGQVGDVAKEIEAIGAETISVKADVGIREEVVNAVKTVVDKFGGVDVLVNNAAIGYEETPFEDHTEEFIKNTFQVNYFGSFFFMQECFPYLKKSKGKIINISSAGGAVGLEFHLGYGSSKEAINAMTRVAAKEWGVHGINVNAICPVAKTDGMQEKEDVMPGFMEFGAQACPLKRLGDPEKDIGGVVAFLASEDAAYITGEIMWVDGGLFTR